MVEFTDKEIICPISKRPCGREGCVCWMIEADGGGCVFQISDQALKESFTTVARTLDRYIPPFIRDKLLNRR